MSPETCATDDGETNTSLSVSRWNLACAAHSASSVESECSTPFGRAVDPEVYSRNRGAPRRPTGGSAAARGVRWNTSSSGESMSRALLASARISRSS